MNLGDKFADLEDCLARIYADLREIDDRALSEEDKDLLSEAFALAGIYWDVLTDNESWNTAHDKLWTILYD